MTTHKRRKYQRQQGSRTYGWGRAHRGSGNKGGSGRAGGGKKAHCKKPSFSRDEFGKRGFKLKSSIDYKIINLKDIDNKLNNWIKEEKIEQKDGIYLINLNKLGYKKLLSSGKVKNKFKIIVEKASSDAIEKVKAAGGLLEIK